VTTCKDKAGVEKSLAEARDWLKANAGHLGLAASQVSEGKSVVHFGVAAAMPA
jgi:hypothetical protein